MESETGVLNTVAQLLCLANSLCLKFLPRNLSVFMYIGDEESRSMFQKRTNIFWEHGGLNTVIGEAHSGSNHL